MPQQARLNNFFLKVMSSIHCQIDDHEKNFSIEMIQRSTMREIHRAAKKYW